MGEAEVVLREQEEAFPFERDETRCGWSARCPVCLLPLAFMSDDFVAAHRNGKPPVFARGMHVCGEGR